MVTESVDKTAAARVFRDRNSWLMVGGVVSIVAVFATDLALPLGVAGGVPYVIPVVLSLSLRGRLYTPAVAATCAGLTVLGFFLSPPGSEPLRFVLINRGYALLTIGLTVAVGWLQRQLVRRNRELSSRTSALETLDEMATGLSALADVRIVKETAVRRARQLLKTDTAGLALLRQATGEIRWELLAGATNDRFRTIRLRLGECIAGQVIQSGEPAIIEDMDPEMEDASLTRPIMAFENLRAALVVPVRIGGRPVGALMVAHRRPYWFHLGDLRLLTSLANHVAVAINNANQLQRLEALAAMEEREHLAREAHDGVAQLLGHIAARSTATSELLAQGKLKEAQQQLARLEEVVQEAHAEVRRSIESLRFPLPQEPNEPGQLGELVRRIADQEGVHLRLESLQGMEPVDWAPAVEVQAIRILQEALRNVYRHSGEREALVKVSVDSQSVTITVQDEGQGFDLTQLNGKGSHFGLLTMQERAEAVGGQLTVETAPGKGTSIIIQLPVRGEE